MPQYSWRRLWMWAYDVSDCRHAGLTRAQPTDWRAALRVIEWSCGWWFAVLKLIHSEPGKPHRTRSQPTSSAPTVAQPTPSDPAAYRPWYRFHSLLPETNDIVLCDCWPHTHTHTHTQQRALHPPGTWNKRGRRRCQVYCVSATTVWRVCGADIRLVTCLAYRALALHSWKHLIAQCVVPCREQTTKRVEYGRCVKAIFYSAHLPCRCNVM